MTSAVEAQGLRKAFRDFTLKDVTFSLPQGYIMGLVGRNGAGKTTTIRLILNMLARDAGAVRVLGMDTIRDEQRIKQDVGVVFDENFFVESWRVSEVERALKGFYSRWSSKEFGRYLKDFGLPADKRLKELSRGMKLKLMLAVAMSHQARLLILDEPTSGLDPVARDELLRILSAYISDGERTVLFSTHITTDLERIADFITLLHEGAVFYTGTKDDLLESYRIVKGGPADLTDRLREKMVGLERTSTGFSGLINASELTHLPGRILAEAPSIDDILVRISAGNTNATENRDRDGHRE
ncbi:MAG TPA: ABC transporter ATP-binding protein [Spirochaetia bacterium]|nr:ABC transporter ATP-binding protein [Spirochaetia bacterium]